MKIRIRSLLSVIIGLAVMLIPSCTKEHLKKTLPDPATDLVTDITQTTAITGGLLVSDGGSPVSARGACWGLAANPTTANSKTLDGAGTGSYVCHLTGLTPGTTYHVRTYATNSMGTGYGNEMTFTTLPSLTGNDGNLYTSVTIGSQVWMVENLKETHFNDGTEIPLVTDNTAWSNLTTAGYSWYNNDASNKDTDGALYNWHTVNSGKLCLAGWHVPTDAEWTTLTTYLGGDLSAAGKLKESGTAHWPTPNAGDTNESGFTAFPGGVRFEGGDFSGVGSLGEWWSSSESSSVNAGSIFMLDVVGGGVGRGQDNKMNGYSVRCLKN